MKEEIECLGDKGYQGIKKIDENSKTPIKKTKKKKLSKEEKIFNRKLAFIKNNNWTYSQKFKYMHEYYHQDIVIEENV